MNEESEMHENGKLKKKWWNTIFFGENDINQPMSNSLYFRYWNLLLTFTRIINYLL
jgi:hypothetical protein